MKTALIIGVDGQDGSYLAELLVEKEYHVVGWTPEGAPVKQKNIKTIESQIQLVQGSLLDQSSLNQLIDEFHPDEIYNLAAPSFPAASWNAPVMVGDIAGLGVLRILEAIRQVYPQSHFFQASSSELFGKPMKTPQNEKTAFYPRNPYGIAKLFGHLNVVTYREEYGLYAASGILYNHESPRRGPQFVTRKIVNGALQIKQGTMKQLSLGNLDARRDWGYAKDYVEAMWMMLQRDQADDFVIGSGETHSVREWCEISFGALDLDYREYVVQDASLYRPAEEVQLVADRRKAAEKLGWEPKTSFRQTVLLMLEAESQALSYTLQKK